VADPLVRASLLHRCSNLPAVLRKAGVGCGPEGPPIGANLKPMLAASRCRRVIVPDPALAPTPVCGPLWKPPPTQPFPAV